MASVTPDLRLPSQLHDITDPSQVPNYTAWRQLGHMCKQLAQGRLPDTQWPGAELATSRVTRQYLNHYRTPPGHRPHSVTTAVKSGTVFVWGQVQLVLMVAASSLKIRSKN